MRSPKPPQITASSGRSVRAKSAKGGEKQAAKKKLRAVAANIHESEGPGDPVPSTPPLVSSEDETGGNACKSVNNGRSGCEATRDALQRSPEPSLPAVGGKKKRKSLPTATHASTTAAGGMGEMENGQNHLQRELEHEAAETAETVVYRRSGILDTSVTFQEFGAMHLDRRITKVLTDELNLKHPTHVQAQASPHTDSVAFALDHSLCSARASSIGVVAGAGFGVILAAAMRL
ncbi:ATP-dependent nucleolar rna [Cyclospora cayetanensis]|uniref:ATP-dependent nucleolar rna n=1 Tax=Cyclospora cayetanensis TaxID=88456 RepID=A0A1D3D4H9_9EIME|nr:ATP-dependent nucleolar rna [Cyclospora cayetanensis]